SVDLKKIAGNRETDRTGLSACATAARVDREVVGIYELCGLKRLQHNILQWRGGKIIFKTATVDVDLACAWHHADACNRSLPATSGDEFLSWRHKITHQANLTAFGCCAACG